jgi:hypothetical protein
LTVTDILPTPGASEECDEAAAAVEQAESELEDVLEEYKAQLKYVNTVGNEATSANKTLPPCRCKDLSYWHSAQGAKASFGQACGPGRELTNPPSGYLRDSGTSQGQGSGKLDQDRWNKGNVASFIMGSRLNFT